MAAGKKSFVIYTSWKMWLDGLSLEQKGLWLDWMLLYTNDENPDCTYLTTLCEDIIKKTANYGILLSDKHIMVETPKKKY